MGFRKRATGDLYFLTASYGWRRRGSSVSLDQGFAGAKTDKNGDRQKGWGSPRHGWKGERVESLLMEAVGLPRMSAQPLDSACGALPRYGIKSSLCSLMTPQERLINVLEDVAESTFSHAVQ